MDQEDFIKELSALGNITIHVAGDLVREKNQTINYTIEKVEAGGIGMNFANDKELPDGDNMDKNKGGRPKRTGKNITKSFVYNAGSETNTRLQYLFNGLIALGWIRDDTDLRSFVSIFSGKDTTYRIVWTGGISTLAELFRELVNRKNYVKLPKGESIWLMVNARFWEKEGNQEFGNDRLCDTKVSLETKDIIDVLVRIMDPDYPVEKVKKMMLTQGK